MKTLTKQLLLFLAAVVFASIGTSCSTLHGLGHDVEKAGNSIQNVGN